MFTMSNTVPFEGMKLFLSLAKGVNLKTFDERSRKSLKQFHNQLAVKDLKVLILGEHNSSVILEEMWQNLYRTVLGKEATPIILERALPSISEEMLGHVLLARMTSRLHIETKDYELLEVGREYTKGGKKEFVPGKKKSAGTETRRHGESFINAAICGFLEEFGLIVEPGDLEVLTTHEVIGDIHQSSVYPDFLSQQIYQSVRLMLPTRLWGDGKIFPDDGVDIHTKWFPLT